MNEHEIQQATSRREEAEAALLRPDGSRYYSDEEHRERQQAIERVFRAEMDAIEERIEERIERAREELLAAEHTDPSSSLSTAELERARAMSQFVSEDLEGLSNAALVQRCSAAMAAGDRVLMYLLQHYATQRSNRHPDGDLGFELRDVARELRSKLDPEVESRLGAAKQAVQDAEDLLFKGQMARAGASNIGDALFGGGTGGNYWGAAS